MFPNRPIAGARIWLSGSVPSAGLSDVQAEAIRKFIRDFVRKIFESGGYIFHGSHPSLVDILLEEAARYHEGHPDTESHLVLVVSQFFSKDPNHPAGAWRKTAVVLETPDVPSPLGAGREASLDEMRRWLVARADAVIAVGGENWPSSTGKAGVSNELDLAFERGLPCFLIAGLGGRAEAHLTSNPDALKKLRNGLTDNENYRLATEANVATLATEVLAQLERLPIVIGDISDSLSFRILSLDGGGLKGAFTAGVLAAWEDHTKLRIADQFDLIAGTSTGGILALGLGLGFSAADLLAFYLERGPTIFPLTSMGARFRHRLKHLFQPKFSQETLLREVKTAFGRDGHNPVLGESRCRLVIPAYHVTGRASHLFRTPHHGDLTVDANTLAAHVAVSTAAAPTYFKSAIAVRMGLEHNYFDGGVWANSPTLAAIVEAITFLKVPMERLDVLSIGTTEEPFDATAGANGGLLAWRNLIIKVMMSAQQESSLKLAEHLVSQARFLRVNHVAPHGRYHLDSPTEISELASLGQNIGLDSRTLGQVKSRFLTGVNAAPWTKY